ncbi:membrane-bound lytic murein transglycosylase B [Vibrio variabilis]|uniref:Membrane-bound lytic murein transglycosylase B n=1 Tax=Vibrio variabilis TaxID=990271 RepID=A0ABQ0J4E5_9VIBR|nr:membrane-bound lytic murein transglycosylase B [Vibrio variabilis]
MKKILSVMLGASLATSAVAQQKESFEEYVAGLKQEAREQGISEQILTEAFAGVEYKPRAVKADRNQPEKRLTLDEYIPRAVPDWKVKQAKELHNKHYAELKRIGDEYGVQPRFIVALWGVESNFGRFTGNYRVIDALSTMAYEGRREAFFRSEALAALTILEQGHIAPEDMKGSWAGAMGQSQFMPSSFLNFAADGNGDGKKDIWDSEADVFASTANYLAKSGWDDQYTWTTSQSS